MLRASTAVFVACALAACSGKLPGDFVGVYAVTGTLREHTCGQQAIPAADPMEFQVELREDAGLGYWIVSPPPRSGSLSAGGAFRFEAESTRHLAPDPSAAPEPDPERESDPSVAVDPERFEPMEPAPNCTLLVRESIRGDLRRPGVEEDAGSRADDLVGENEMDVSTAAGSDCGFALSEQGGPWEQLPCRVAYDLEGQLLDSTEPR